WPKDQWKGVTRVALQERGAPELLHGEPPPSEHIARAAQETTTGLGKGAAATMAAAKPVSRPEAHPNYGIGCQHCGTKYVNGRPACGCNAVKASAPLFERACFRCGKVVQSAQPIAST